MRGIAALMLLAAPLAASPVPSGQDVSLHEVLVDPQSNGTWVRFRYLAPQIARGDDQVPFEVSGRDMMHICQSVALPYMSEHALQADKIVISFMDRVTEFGQPDPDATQYFEAFRAENGTCIWDEF